MSTTYTKARFWKCALQVNPAGYIAYQGTDHGMTEAQYNAKLVQVALENDIKVIGLADHGCVDGVDAIKNAMNAAGILAFPGFEISSSEKIHFVCLYSEDTSLTELHRYLGDLQLLDTTNGIRPSRLSAEQLLSKIEEHGGFIYAAHCTGDSGLLQRRLNHIWQNPLLKAVQIPGIIDDLLGVEDGFYRKVICNKEAAYKREQAIAVINAKDVAVPEDLANPQASCLIKMTTPGFDAFRLAFKDPESRVRLNSDMEEKYYSQLENLKVTGGYLDGLEINFSEHLNAIIGGRGTGKSTLMECVRYALGQTPIGENAKKQHTAIIKENMGKTKARIELSVRSSKMNGQRFRIARRYGEIFSVLDEYGNPSSFLPEDLLPGIEIFGQNEIYEIAQSRDGQRKLLERFLDSGHAETEGAIKEAVGKLAENRKNIVAIRNDLASVEDQVARLPKLEEQIGQFKKLGLEDKLQIIPLLERSRRLLERAHSQEGPNLEKAVHAIRDSLPDTVFLGDTALEGLPQAEIFRKVRMELEALCQETEQTLIKWQAMYDSRQSRLADLAEQIHSGISTEEAALEQTFRELPACEGKSGKEVGLEYQRLLKEVERIRPQEISVKTHQKLLDERMAQRKAIHDVLSTQRAERSAYFERTLKRLNKRLAGQLKLQVKTEANRRPVVDFLLNCHLEGVGEARLAWIEQAQDFSPIKLAELIRQGPISLREAHGGVTPTVAESLCRLTPDQLFQLEEIELPDVVEIELNISHGGPEHYRSIDKLSTGQQCTAILHLLLLENKDPLLMDQPEDNLDNAFIADRIVAELRRAKISRQFIFATHNANIPVFGDAEWIGVFESEDGNGIMPESSQGAIDVPHVRDKAAKILEGGKTAFIQRKEKYGY